MPSKKTPPLPTNDCSSCGDPVKVRRPSQHGQHWCQKRECQTAKARFYRHLNKAPDQSIEGARIEFIHDLAHLDRKRCSMCGLPNALPGWGHRSAADPTKPCTHTGPKGAALGSMEWFDTVWPDQAAQAMAAGQ